MIVQQDFGTTAIMLAILVTMLFCAGTRMLYLVPVPIVGFAGLILITRFLNRNAMDVGWLFSFGPYDRSGPARKIESAAPGPDRPRFWADLTGLGLGNSRQKMYWLPEVNTDFVFPIIGEELGMLVTLAVVLSFLLLVLCAAWITVHAPDPSGVLLGTGLTMMITLQALMNLAVVTSLMPCKGIPLPFISYGGSNLLTCLAAIGMLFNLHRQGIYQTSSAPQMAATAYSVRM